MIPPRFRSRFASTEGFTLPPSHGLRFDGTRFWVTHRRRKYGPFDYEWSQDFLGIELLFRGRKFGEYCSSEEIYADLKQFRLPMRVVEVASIVLGCTLYGVLNGWSRPEREQLLIDRLCSMGHQKFAHIDRHNDTA